MITAFAKGFQAFGEEKYLKVAKKPLILFLKLFTVLENGCFTAIEMKKQELLQMPMIMLS